MVICDEYQAFASVGEDDPSGDEKAFALTRQCRVIPIVATQSISSLRSVLGSGEAWRTLLQTLRTRIFLGSPKVRVGHIARLSRGGCSSMLVQQSMIMPMSAAAEWKPKARRVITRTLLCSPSTMPLVTPQRI